MQSSPFVLESQGRGFRWMRRGLILRIATFFTDLTASEQSVMP
jgi:hypothetical protein